MLTLLGGRPDAFAPVAAITHHFVGADAGGTVAGLWHALATVIVPAVLISVAGASALLSTASSVRRRLATDRADSSSALACSPADDAGGQTGEHRPTQAVDRFYRVTFADERGFRLWTERVVEFTSILQDVFPDLRDVRPVIFVELKPAPGATPKAYVSAGARGLAAHISGGVTVDPAPVRAADLPRGLRMLFGEGVDAAEYERRHA